MLTQIKRKNQIPLAARHREFISRSSLRQQVRYRSFSSQKHLALQTGCVPWWYLFVPRWKCARMAVWPPLGLCFLLGGWWKTWIYQFLFGARWSLRFQLVFLGVFWILVSREIQDKVDLTYAIECLWVFNMLDILSNLSVNGFPFSDPRVIWVTIRHVVRS